MSSEWWLPSPTDVLSQGDVFIGLPIGCIGVPPKYLQKVGLKGNAPGGWQEVLEWKPDHNGVGSYLTRGKLASAIVLTYGCDVDKQRRTHRIVVAGVNAIASLSAEEQAIVMGQDAYHSMPIPGIPQLGDCYIDFRLTTFLPKEIVDSAKKVSSMTDQAVLLLQARLVAFFTRIDISKLQV